MKRFITGSIEVEVEVDGVLVKGRLLSTSEINEIRNKHYRLNEYIVIGKDGDERTEERVSLNTNNYAREIFTKTITSIGENAVDLTGNKLQCTEETLRDIYDYNNDFSELAIRKIRSAIDDLRKDEKKILTPGQDGTSPQEEQPAQSAPNTSSKSARNAKSQKKD